MIGPMRKLLQDIRQRVAEGAKFFSPCKGTIREFPSMCCPAVVAVMDGRDVWLNEDAEFILVHTYGMTPPLARRFINAADNNLLNSKTAALRRALLRACGLEERC